jgi:hypothetical protein
MGFVILFTVVWIFDPVLHILKPKKSSQKDRDKIFYGGSNKEK